MRVWNALDSPMKVAENPRAGNNILVNQPSSQPPAAVPGGKLTLSVAPNTPVATLRPGDLPNVREVEGLYLHVPFCFHKCHYCDFYSITRQSPQRMEQYVDRVLREADLWAASTAAGGPVLRPRTIFFGGGTPTLLPVVQMHKLIAGIKQRFDFSAVEEWTVEANPKTIDAEYCRVLRDAGVDRISFGAQSFDQAELAMLERHHAPDDVRASVEIARNAGFKRLNIDLIYAIPGQDLSSWQRSLESALRLGTDHISCYALTYEPNTPMAVRKRLGEFAAAEESLELSMLRHARTRLREAGLPPYEISNYAEAGQKCLHNLMYWTGGNYIGLGPSAASHVSGWRWKNRPHLGEWEQATDAHNLPAADVEQLPPFRRAAERIMLQLRLTQGVEYDEFAEYTGYEARDAFADPLARLSKLGLIESDANGFRVSEAGVPVADAIAAEFLACEERA